ncbi:MAG: DUF134 domain-containing protein [Bacteroidales bacterium]
MSPRRKLLRKVSNPPVIKGFKPYGPDVHQGDGAVVLMQYEEYEALRLCDYDLLNHEAASRVMGISRPTFTRIYALARQKIARAFVEGRQISFEGGKVYFDSDWYSCGGCGCYFNNPEKDQSVISCPLCGEDSIQVVDAEPALSPESVREDECTDFCVCPECGYQIPHLRGIPCSQQSCPECKMPLNRKSGPNMQVFRHRSGKRHQQK